MLQRGGIEMIGTRTFEHHKGSDRRGSVLGLSHGDSKAWISAQGSDYMNPPRVFQAL